MQVKKKMAVYLFIGCNFELCNDCQSEARRKENQKGVFSDIV